MNIFKFFKSIASLFKEIPMNENISLDELSQKLSSLKEGEIILDVRRPEEFDEGHIPGARNISYELVGNYIDELKKYQSIYIHCKMGPRAKMAFQTLKNAGLNNVICISDAGMKAWIERGYPVGHDKIHN